MENPRPSNLQTDETIKSQGWEAVARDDDGHVMTVCARDGINDETFKDWLLEVFDARWAVTKLQDTYVFRGS